MTSVTFPPILIPPDLSGPIPALFLPSDLLLASLVAIVAFLWLYLIRIISKIANIPPAVTRKLVHLTCGPFFTLTWTLFSTQSTSRYVAAIVPTLFIIRILNAGSTRSKDFLPEVRKLPHPQKKHTQTYTTSGLLRLELHPSDFLASSILFLVFVRVLRVVRTVRNDEKQKKDSFTKRSCKRSGRWTSLLLHCSPAFDRSPLAIATWTAGRSPDEYRRWYGGGGGKETGFGHRKMADSSPKDLCG